MSFGVIFIATCATYFIFTTWFRKLRCAEAIRLHGCKPVPTVASWDPILGIDNIINIFKADARGHRSEAHRTLHKKYGSTFTMKMVGRTQLQTCHPENIRAICTSAFNDWGVGPIRGRLAAPFLDRGIFTEDGDFWRHSRALIKPTFSKTEIADLLNFEKYVVRFLNLIPKDGSTFDLLPLVKRLVSSPKEAFLVHPNQLLTSV